MSFLATALMGLLYAALTCAIIILIAWCIVWLCRFFGVAIDGEVLKWGKIVVGLLCVIVIVGFLLNLLVGGASYTPFHLPR